MTTDQRETEGVGYIGEEVAFGEADAGELCQQFAPAEPGPALAVEGEPSIGAMIDADLGDAAGHLDPVRRPGSTADATT